MLAEEVGAITAIHSARGGMCSKRSRSHFNNSCRYCCCLGGVTRVWKRRKHNCRSHSVEKPSSTRSSIIGGGAKCPSRGTKMLVVSIIVVIAVLSTWFIRDSVLYERTDDAQIDGNIMPLSAR